jgi:hypothetical protein
MRKVYINVVKSIKITKCLSYNNYGTAKVLEQDLINFFIEIGNNKIESEHLAKVVQDVFTVAMKKLDSPESFWLKLQASLPNSFFKIPRWHFDGDYFDTKETNHKFIFVLSGPGTLFGKTNNRKKFNKISNLSYGLSNEEILSTDVNSVRQQLAEIVELKYQIEKGYGVIYRTGTTKGEIHSEPDYSRKKRLFLSILPGTKKQIAQFEKQRKINN